MKHHRNDNTLSLCLLIAAVVMLVVSLIFWSAALFCYLLAALLAVAFFFALAPTDPAEGPVFRFTLKWLFQKHGRLEHYRTLILIGYGVLSAGSLGGGMRKAGRNLSEMTGGLIGKKPAPGEDHRHS